MRVLSVIASLDPAGGGVAMAARQIVRQFLSRDIEAEIVCVDEPSCVYPGDAGLVVHRLGPGRFGYGWSARLIPWLKANRDRFDAVICHGLWLFPSHAVWRALRGNAKKLKAEMLTEGAPAPLSGEATPQSLRKRDRQPNDFSVSGFQRSSVSAFQRFGSPLLRFCPRHAGPVVPAPGCPTLEIHPQFDLLAAG